MVCVEDLNLQRTFRHLFIKDGLSIKSAIVVADTRVVASDNEMSAAHVLPEISV